MLLPLHGGFHASPPPVQTRLLVAVLAGVLATLIMNVPLRSQSEGTTPTFLLAAVLTGQSLTAVSPRRASVVHYGLGVLAAVAHTLSAIGLETALPSVAFLASVRLYLVPHLLAGLLLLGVLFGGFTYVVLPLAGEEAGVSRGRVSTQWLLSVTVYVLALLAAVPATLTLVG